MRYIYPVTSRRFVLEVRHREVQKYPQNARHERDAPFPLSVFLALGVVGRARDRREEKQRERFENVVI